MPKPRSREEFFFTAWTIVLCTLVLLALVALCQ